MRIFFTVWMGQLVSLLGSGLTRFALQIWVFQSTGSTSLFALASLGVVLPNLLLSPLAGTLVDRWDRRRVMLLSELGGGLCSLAAALLLHSGRGAVWSVCLLIAINFAFDAFRTPAWISSTSLLVPPEQLSRASGLVQTGQALTQLAAPLLAGVLVVWVGVEGVLLLDAGSFAAALLALALVRFPRPESSAEGRAGRGSLLEETLQGWRYVRARAGLTGLLALDFALNFTVGMANVALTPLVLASHSPAMLGTIFSAGGLGMLVGSLLLSAWRGPSRKVLGVFGFSVGLGLSLGAFGLLPVGPLACLASFGMCFCMPPISGFGQVIWQRKVAADLQGRVFALMGMVAQASTPVVLLLLGPLVDGALEPWMRPGGALAGSAGRLLGVGPGRGTALLFVGLGLLTLLATALAALAPRIRRVEDELPDAVAEPPAALAPTP